jgi:hypothetical protein
VRESDDLILAVLDLRRRKMPSQVAKKLGVTRDQVIQICAEIRDADVKVSTKKNVETLYEILLHYPHT